MCAFHTATQVWHCYQRELTPEYFEPLCDFVYTRPEEVIRNMIGNAFMHGMLRYPGWTLFCFPVALYPQ